MFCYILGKSECSFHVNITASETVSDLMFRAAILDKNKQKLVGVDAVQKFLSTAFSENKKCFKNSDNSKNCSKKRHLNFTFLPCLLMVYSK